jgi:hypothetical protein
MKVCIGRFGFELVLHMIFVCEIVIAILDRQASKLKY